MSFRISSRLEGDVTILDLSGRISMGEGSVNLRDTVKKLLSEGRKNILLNMGDVPYIDSSGVGEMVSANSRVRAQGGKMKLLDLTKKIHDLLQITKFYTVFEVFDDEAAAIRSFGYPHFFCHCPICECTAGPALHDQDVWPPQTCRKCNATFKVASSDSWEYVSVTSLQIQTRENEYFEILPGSPFTVNIVGRLDLFASSALTKAWKVVPAPHKVIFDLHQTTEVDEAGRDALLAVLLSAEEGSRAVLSLEGLTPEATGVFWPGLRIYKQKAAALQALGDVSTPSPWLVRIRKS